MIEHTFVKEGALDDYTSRATETPEQIFGSVFPDPGGDPMEMPMREGKSYALTAARFKEKKDALVKLIASIANRGSGVGYVVFRGSSQEEPLVDGAMLDDAVRSNVHPHVSLALNRHRSDQRVIDILRIGPSPNRPHLMRNSGGELIIPFRGAANNITAGRYELDEMYLERRQLEIRRDFLRAGLDDTDHVEEFLLENDWGGLSETTDPEFVFAVVPEFLTQTPLAKFIAEPSSIVHSQIYAVWDDTIRADGDTDWFTVRGGIVTSFHDNYYEMYQPALDNHRIGTIRIYDTGAIVTRIWILEPFIDKQDMYSFNHFKTALRASLRFSWRLYNAASYPAGDVQVRCALANTEDLNLWIVPSGNPRNVMPNRDVGRRLFLPKRPVVIDPHRLEDEAGKISEQVGRVLRTHYGS